MQAAGVITGSLLFFRNQVAWSIEDWRAFWGERAGVAEWLSQHPVRSDPRWCAHCGRADDLGEPLVPAGVEPRMGWLHPDCWSEWPWRRQVAAGRALRELGLPETAGDA